MKLLFAIKSLSLPGGGAERVLAEVAFGLAARGHDVSVVSFDSPGTTDFYGFPPPIWRERLGIGKSDARSGAVMTLRRIAALRKEIAKQRPDVAIGFMHSAYVPLGLAAARTGVPVIASEHIVYGHYKDRPLERALLRLLLPFVRRITAVAASMRDSFPEAIQRKMIVLPNPVATNPAKADVVGGAQKTLLTVGRLEDQKDHQVLIEAFRRIAADFPNWHLKIVGEGVLREPLQAQIAAAGLQNQVSLPGATADINSEYRGAQLFVLPSRYESFGLATAEALSFGLPAIGFADCPGTNELIVPGVNGLLVDGTDRAQALARALAELMASDETRVRMSAHAAEQLQPYSIDRVVDQWEAITRLSKA